MKKIEITKMKKEKEKSSLIWEKTNTWKEGHNGKGERAKYTAELVMLTGDHREDIWN